MKTISKLVLACGIPCVTFDTGGLGEKVDEKSSR